MARGYHIAEIYQKYVDTAMAERLVEDNRTDWLDEGFEIAATDHVELSIDRWRLMVNWRRLEMPRRSTANEARRAAEEAAKWLMVKWEMPGVNWRTLKGEGPLMPTEEEEVLDLNHRTASLELGSWLNGWRADTLAVMTLWATMGEACLTHPPRWIDRKERKRINRSLAVIQGELDAVIQAIHHDQSLPRRKKASEEEE